MNDFQTRVQTAVKPDFVDEERETPYVSGRLSNISIASRAPEEVPANPGRRGVQLVPRAENQFIK